MNRNLRIIVGLGLWFAIMTFIAAWAPRHGANLAVILWPMFVLSATLIIVCYSLYQFAPKRHLRSEDHRERSSRYSDRDQG